MTSILPNHITNSQFSFYQNSWWHFIVDYFLFFQMSFFVVSCGGGGGFWLFFCNTGYSFSVSFDASFFSSWPLFFGMSQSHLWAFSLSQLTPMVISSSYMAWNDIYKFVITKCMSFLISDLSYEPHISSGHLKFNLAIWSFLFHIQSILLSVFCHSLKT